MTEAGDKVIQVRRERFGFKRPVSRISKESVDAVLSHQYVCFVHDSPRGHRLSTGMEIPPLAEVALSGDVSISPSIVFGARKNS